MPNVRGIDKLICMYNEYASESQYRLVEELKNHPEAAKTLLIEYHRCPDIRWGDTLLVTISAWKEHFEKLPQKTYRIMLDGENSWLAKRNGFGSWISTQDEHAAYRFSTYQEAKRHAELFQGCII